VLHAACGNRREAVCPACSQVYKRDARQLVRAGPDERDPSRTLPPRPP